MAYRRSVTSRAKFFYQQQQRFSPSISNTHRDDNASEELQAKPIPRYTEAHKYIQHRFHLAGNYLSNQRRSVSALRDRRFAAPMGFGMAHGRNYSTSGIGEKAVDKIVDLQCFTGEVLTDTAVQAAPVLSEVAVAAADSYAPVAALQYLIDYVHCFTGLDWWASIVVTTLIIRWLQLPLLIYIMKANTKLAILRPRLEELKAEIEDNGSQTAYLEGQAKMKALFREHGVAPYTPFLGILISGPLFCSFFFAISNMAAKVPSFKDGGILWFTDLATQDSLYLFPVLTALTFWIMVEYNAQEGLEHSPNSAIIKNVMRAFAALSIPLTQSFPKAVFCYWMTSNLFSLAYGLTIKKPKVKKLLGIPEMPVPPPSTNQKPSLSFIESIKKHAEAQANKYQSLPSSAEEASSKPIDRRITSTSRLNEKVKSLEKKAKGRKRGKKR